MNRTILFCLTFALFSFVSVNAQDGPWGEWTNASCYLGIDVRVRFDSNGSGCDWQIRSRYDNPVHVNFKFGDELSWGRTWLYQGQTSEVYYVNGKSMSYYVEKLRFGGEYEDYGDYYGCDQ